MGEKLKGIVLSLIGYFLLIANLFAEVELTVYNQDLGLVREEREIEIEEGIRELEIKDVAAYIEPTSLHFKSLNYPEDLRILEQNFEYDLISRDKLLEKYIGKEIEIKDKEKNKVMKGILLSKRGGLVVKVGKKIYLEPEGMIILPELPEGLITQPTLSLQVENKKHRKHRIEISYLTKGIRWRADYVLVLDKDSRRADLNGWVSIDNKSGKTYKETKLKLVAGDIHKVEKQKLWSYRNKVGLAEEAVVPQFKEKGFFEYHLYTLDRKTTVKDNEIKQIEFVSVYDIPVEKVFVYEGVKHGKRVEVRVEFENKKKNGLGIPFPKGRVRVYQPDEDENLIFIGGDEIEHTPAEEEL
ncbi:MAG: DUF4139 domain-containing protein, partial [Caldiserica bacterium]